MALESTLVCLDNSEFMRNGDYLPSRVEAQKDAAKLVTSYKTMANPENTDGIVSMAGSDVRVLASPTIDMGRLLKVVAELDLGGTCDVAAGLQVAALALKHRSNKNGGQRVVLFVGSPVTTPEKKLSKVAKSLKKNNVAVDVVLMGDIEENERVMRAFVDVVDKNSNSHVLVVPAGVLPSDVIVSSPILNAGSSSGSGAGGGESGDGEQAQDRFAEYGGVDPSLDPELAMAIRASMEEERERLERAAASASAAEGVEDSNAKQNDDEPVIRELDQNEMELEAKRLAEEEAEEERIMQEALLLSMGGGGGDNDEEDEDQDDEDEDEQLRLALEMSKKTNDEDPDATSSKSESDVAFENPDFVKNLLSDLPGVDTSDPQIQALLASMAQQAEESAKSAKKDDDDENRDESSKKQRKS